MKKINRVMACFDFSDYSRYTVEYALELTRGKPIEILLFNVVNAKDVEAVRTASKYYPEAIDVDRYVEEALADRYKRLGEVIAEHFSADAAKIKSLVHVGIPFEEIINVVETENIDLVLMGNKGRSNLSRTLFGSNAEKVFRHSPVPVLSVRGDKQFGRDK